jgi:hypothetical protein
MTAANAEWLIGRGQRNPRAVKWRAISRKNGAGRPDYFSGNSGSGMSKNSTRTLFWP